MSDVVHFNCPACGTGLKAKASAVGKIIECPGCAGRVLIPEPALALPDEQSSAAKHEAANPRKSRKAMFGVTAALVLAAADGAYFLLTALRVKKCYVIDDVVVISNDGRQFANVDLLVVRTHPGVKGNTTDYHMVAPDGRVFKAEAGVWQFRTGGADWLKIAVPRNYVETGGLKLQYEDSRAASLPAKIEHRKVNDLRE